MIWLGAAAHGQDDNLNLIRMVAASAVLVSLLLVSFVLGPLTTGLPLAKYLTARGNWMAVYSNLTLYSPQFWLPGVFNKNPFPAVQGSIWTLVHIALALPLTLVAAVLSWHLIERPALAVLRRMRQAHQIDVKDRVDHPVEAVFDARVGADGAGETL